MENSFVIAELCIYILTWNVGTNHPNNISLIDMLALNGATSCPDNKLPDIYVLGFQEVNSATANPLFNIFQDNEWTLKIGEHLSEYRYVKLETEQMLGILINLWTKPKHVSNMEKIKTQTTKTGFGGIWGNKGAVSIRLNLYGTGVTFIVAHLAAHDEKLKERVEDYNQIVNNHKYKVKKFNTIFDHDVVFWSGDLNFRLNGNDSPLDVQRLVELNRLDDLFIHDQLSMVRQTGNAFALMEEQQPTFPPTFKFVEGTSEYNLKRRPAWCDRVLYRVVENKYPDKELLLQQLSYKSHPQYTLSDHKPVTAEFLYTIKGTTDSEYIVYPMAQGGSETSLSKS